MKTEKIRFPSADGKHRIAGVFFTASEIEPKAVIQLSHGMCEHIGRYREMAEFFTERGYAVAGHDHLGHGDSVEPREYGRFKEEHLIGDLRRMNALIGTRFPDLPVILYGHSMGSFFARLYAKLYPNTVKALVLSGTAGPSPLVKIGKLLAGFLEKIRTPDFVSPFLVKMNFGGYNKRIPHPRTEFDWLTREEAVVDRYRKDPKCGFSFSVGAYRAMLTVLDVVSRKEWAESLPKSLPVFLLAGEADPVGNYGKGVQKVAEMLKKAGMRDVSLYLDKNGRHELHNEKNRISILKKIADWTDQKIGHLEEE